MNSEIKKVMLAFLIIFSFVTLFQYNNANEITDDVELSKTSNTIKSSNQKVHNIKLIENPYYIQNYNIGEEIDITGITAKVIYDDLSSEIIYWNDERILVEGFDSTKEGKNLVHIYFQDENTRVLLCSYIATIKKVDQVQNTIEKKYSNSLLKSETNTSDILYAKILKKPTKTTYLVGEDIDLSGLEISFCKKTGETVTYPYTSPYMKVTVSNYDADKIGLQKVYIGVKLLSSDFSKTFTIDIAIKEHETDKVPVKMIVAKYPKEWSKEEVEIDWKKARFQIEYDDGSTELMEYNDEDFSYELYDNNSSVAVTYKESLEVIFERKKAIDKSTDINVNYSLEESDLFSQNLYDISSNDIPRKYDLREKLELKVPNQNGEGLCWNFATTKSLETNFYLNYGFNYDLSERFADYISSNLFYGEWEQGDGGTFARYSDYVQNTGVPLETAVPYKNFDASEFEKIENADKVVSLDSFIRFPDTIQIEENKELRNNMIKKHIMQNGSVYLGVTCTYPALNDSTFYYDYSLPSETDGHVVSIIGWDDTYPKENFYRYDENQHLTYPQNDGAWIAMNSWGESFGEQGYLYVSYDSQDMEYYGVLKSKPYVATKQYTYANVKPYTDSIHYLHKNKRYIYVEFEKEDITEYLTNMTLKMNANNVKIYVLDNYDEIDFTRMKYIGTYNSPVYFNGNCVLNEPVALNGDKYMLIFEFDELFDPIVPYRILSDGEKVHTFYSVNELSTEWEECVGDIYLSTFTITPEQYKEMQDDKNIESISITKLPNKLKYYNDEDIDLSSGEITVTYKNGETKVISMLDENVHAYGITANTKDGNHFITVTYKGYQDMYDVDVIAITKVEIAKMPNNNIFYVWEKTSLVSGGQIKVTYSDGNTKLVSMDSNKVKIYDENDVLLTSGNDFFFEEEFYGYLYIKYMNYSFPFVIDVLPARVTKIKVPQISSGDQYSYTGDEIVLKFDYFDDQIMTLSGDYSATNFGTYKATVSFKNPDQYIWDVPEGISNEPIYYEWRIMKANWTATVKNNMQNIDSLSEIDINIFPLVTDGVLNIKFKSIEQDVYYDEVPNQVGEYDIIISLSGDTNLNDDTQYEKLIINPSNVMKGDVNGDGKLSLIDVRLLLQQVINNTYNSSNIIMIDYNEDGKVSLIDVRLLLQRVING